jgi:hypothetical protein
MGAIPPSWQPDLWSALTLLGAALLALIGHRLLYFVLGRSAARTNNPVHAALLRYSRRPAGLALPLVAVFVVLPRLPWPERLGESLQHLTVLALIAAVTWLGLRILDALVEAVGATYRVDVKDNLRARKIETQVRMLRRMSTVVIVFVAGSLMLMTFPAIRQVGITLFASAGLAKLIAGMAARSRSARSARRLRKQSTRKRPRRRASSAISTFSLTLNSVNSWLFW